MVSEFQGFGYWRGTLTLSHRMYVSVNFRKSTPPQNRQLILNQDESKYKVDGFVGELTFSN